MDSAADTDLAVGGFPHSGISGSTLAASFPELIAANHALHRLLDVSVPPLTPVRPMYSVFLLPEILGNLC